MAHWSAGCWRKVPTPAFLASLRGRRRAQLLYTWQWPAGACWAACSGGMLDWLPLVEGRWCFLAALPCSVRRPALQSMPGHIKPTTAHAVPPCPVCSLRAHAKRLLKAVPSELLQKVCVSLASADFACHALAPVDRMLPLLLVHMPFLTSTPPLSFAQVLSAADSKKRTLLHLAVQAGDAELVGQLLDKVGGCYLLCLVGEHCQPISDFARCAACCAPLPRNLSRMLHVQVGCCCP